MDTVLLASWSSLFSSAASVSATLIGFAAVALSVNLQQILTSPWLLTRAAQALIRLVSALLLSLLMQVPDSQHGFRTATIIVLMLGFKAWAVLIDTRTKRPIEYVSYWSSFMLIVVGQLVSLAFLLTGIPALDQSAGGPDSRHHRHPRRHPADDGGHLGAADRNATLTDTAWNRRSAGRFATLHCSVPTFIRRIAYPHRAVRGTGPSWS